VFDMIDKFDEQNENLVLSDQYLEKLSQTIAFDLDFETLGIDI
jgi:hypothetical protein